MAQADDRFPDLIRGDTYRFELSFADGAGAPVDVTGWQIALTMKSDPDDADAVAIIRKVQTVPAGAAAEAGSAELVLTSEDTQVAPGRYWMDLERRITGTPDDVKTLRVQRIEVLADIGHG